MAFSCPCGALKRLPLWSSEKTVAMFGGL